jgi:precorrin isomerase
LVQLHLNDCCILEYLLLVSSLAALDVVIDPAASVKPIFIVGVACKFTHKMQAEHQLREATWSALIEIRGISS